MISPTDKRNKSTPSGDMVVMEGDDFKDQLTKEIERASTLMIGYTTQRILKISMMILV